MATFYGTWYQSDKFPSRVAGLKWYGSTLQAKVDNMAYQFFSLKSVYTKYPNFPGSSKCRCIAKNIVYLESRWNPNESYTNENGSIDRGLWQINSIHQTSDMSAWWPENNGYTLSTIFNAEYNTRYAFTFFNARINSSLDPWVPWNSYSEAVSKCR